MAGWKIPIWMFPEIGGFYLGFFPLFSPSILGVKIPPVFWGKIHMPWLHGWGISHGSPEHRSRVWWNFFKGKLVGRVTFSHTDVPIHSFWNVRVRSPIFFLLVKYFGR